MRLSSVPALWRWTLGLTLLALGVAGFAELLGECVESDTPCAGGYHLEIDRDTCREELVPVGAGVGQTVVCDMRCTK